MPEVKKRDDEDPKIHLVPIAGVTLDVGLGPKSRVQRATYLRTCEQFEVA
jgi:hypothetical protein